jgi:Rhodopirellula transposase DDE domain
MQDPQAMKRVAAIYEALAPVMDERMRRQWAAAEAQAYGWGGARLVSAAIHMSANTIRKGMSELTAQEAEPDLGTNSGLRRKGGGRKQQTEVDAGLQNALEKLIDPATRGDPQSPLRWTCKSTTHLAKELTRQKHRVSASTVGRLLKASGYSLQSNRKTREGASHPDRNEQFEYINQTTKDFQQRGQPVVSVDTKKKELVGEFRNAGREWQRKGEPVEVLIHDFMDKELGKAIPYGVYDVSANQGWVSVGIDHDTARFAAEAIRRWWLKMGKKRHRQACELLIMADGGGSNGSRSRLWKVALQGLANYLGIPTCVCHFPPGTSKWNKIEHRMFSHITQNWRGRPLISHEVIVNLIAATSTQHGLNIQAALDSASYPTGLKISDDELATVNLKRADFHGDWNYRVLPSHKKK